MQRVTLLISLLIIEIGVTFAFERCGIAHSNKSCFSGQCCSRYGYCGSTEDQCLDGCQSAFGRCGMSTTKAEESKPVTKLATKPMTKPETKPVPLPISQDGSCGPTKRCPDGTCCSKFGFCGVSPTHCGDGCQEAYGRCSAGTQPPTNGGQTAGPSPVLDSTSQPIRSGSSARLPVSTDGSCGNGFRCPDDFCCSRFGYCGKSSSHCGLGCQPEFGICRPPTTPPPSYCGAQYGNRSCPTGLCCGADGLCGVGDAFCAAPSCQASYGGCNFQPLPPVAPRTFDPIYSPYVLVEDAFTNYAVVAKRYAVRWLTMAFVISVDGAPFWGYSWRADGTDPEDKVYKQIVAMRKVGVDAIGSFGGASGDELATVIKNDETLLKAYQSVVSAYKFQFVDFDIEGSSLADVASNRRRNRVLAHLQRANPNLLLSFTLPVLTTGLTEIGLNMLKDANAVGVRIDAVNIMAMDYGTGVTDMGKGAIDAIVHTQAQLKALGLKSCVGVIPMIGVNDVETEIFRQDDAHELVNFVKDPKNNVCLTSFWSLDRDRSASTRIPQTDFEFTKILGDAYAMLPHKAAAF